jgi:vacuolar protein sorting-associated protein 13A/C
VLLFCSPLFLRYGARDLGLGLVRGISGVVLEPVRGAREDGVRGFFTGISRGITGLYVKVRRTLCCYVV